MGRHKKIDNYETEANDLERASTTTEQVKKRGRPPKSHEEISSITVAKTATDYEDIDNRLKSVYDQINTLQSDIAEVRVRITKLKSD